VRPTHIQRLFNFTLLLILVLISSGCGTTPATRFYLLNASGNPQADNPPQFTVGLGPIQFPAYLDRSKIIMRTGPNSFKTAEYHRWGEPLETNFTQVLAQNLGNALPNAVVTTYPWRGSKEIKVQVFVNVLSFDTDHNNQARLNVRWELIGADHKTIAPPQQHEYLKTASSSDYAARVQAMSECVAELGRALAQEIAEVTP
jgi:uncharacterized lipoprotein YmbA